MTARIGSRPVPGENFRIFGSDRDDGIGRIEVAGATRSKFLSPYRKAMPAMAVRTKRRDPRIPPRHADGFQKTASCRKNARRIARHHRPHSPPARYTTPSCEPRSVRRPEKGEPRVSHGYLGSGGASPSRHGRSAKCRVQLFEAGAGTNGLTSPPSRSRLP